MFENGIYIPSIKENKKFRKEYYKMIANPETTRAAMQNPGEISELFTQAFDSLLDLYSEKEKESESLTVELKEKKDYAADLKKKYLNLNISLMKLTHGPLHKNSNTPLNRWTSQSLIEPEIISENKIEKEGNSEIKKEEEIVPVQPIIITPQNIPEIKSNEIAEIKKDSPPPKQVENIKIEVQEITELVPVIEEKKIPSPPKKIIKKKIKKEENTPKIMDESIILDTIIKKITEFKEKLMTTNKSILISENEIKLTNLTGAHLECIFSYLSLSAVNTESENISAVNFLPKDITSLIELLFASDYMLLEVYII